MWQYKSAREDKITMSSGNRGILQVFRRAVKKAKNFRLFTKRWVSFPEMFVFWISNRFARDRCSLQTRRCTTLFVSLLLHTHQRAIRTFLSKYFFATLANRRVNLVNTHNLVSFSSAIEVYTDKRETAGFWLSLCETNLKDRTWLVQSEVEKFPFIVKRLIIIIVLRERIIFFVTEKWFISLARFKTLPVQ